MSRRLVISSRRNNQLLILQSNFPDRIGVGNGRLFWREHISLLCCWKWQIPSGNYFQSCSGPEFDDVLIVGVNARRTICFRDGDDLPIKLNLCPWGNTPATFVTLTPGFVLHSRQFDSRHFIERLHQYRFRFVNFVKIGWPVLGGKYQELAEGRGWAE